MRSLDSVHIGENMRLSVRLFQVVNRWTESNEISCHWTSHKDILFNVLHGRVRQATLPKSNRP
jgi:hypothetical protein